MTDFSLVRTRLPPHIANPDPLIFRSNNYVSLDFETTTRDKGAARNSSNSIVFSSWELSGGHPNNRNASSGQRPAHTMRSAWGGEFDLNILVKDIEQADFLIAHNAKFELGWLKRCGLDLTKVVVWDTMIGEYVLGGNTIPLHIQGLGASANRRLGKGKIGVISKMFKAGLCSTEIPSSWLARYCKKDTSLARELFQEQLRLMEEDGHLLPVMFTRCLVTPVLADIEGNGMTLDADLVCTMYEDKSLAYGKLRQELDVMIGDINPNSPKQLGVYLYETLGFEQLRKHGRVRTTPSGNPLTNAETVLALKATTKQQRAFKALFTKERILNTELSMYLNKFMECCDNDEGHLDAVFNQTVTKTHRLSSSGATYKTQFQNFPRAYKPVFTARHKGWRVGEADGAQLEFRIATHLGRDTTALSDILNGEDIHRVTASVIFNKEQAVVTGDERTAAKAHTFKPLYGGRSGTKDEVRYYEFFRSKYKGITATQEGWINEVLTNKKLRTEWGLTYYWPDTRMSSSGYVSNTTSICNYPVQAFATAEIIPVGLAYFWHYIKAAELQMMIVNTVHDSIITELPDEEIEDFHELSKICLIEEVYAYLKTVYNIELTVPLGAGVATGSHWSNKEAKESEVVYEANKELYL